MMRLTTNHASSSYGQTVMVNRNGEAFGPADLYPRDPLRRTCAEVMSSKMSTLSKPQQALAERFCRVMW